MRSRIAPLARRPRKSAVAAAQVGVMATVFRPPLLRRTLIGIAVGTIPLLGGWGATQWFIPWADKVGGAADPRAKALTGDHALGRRRGRQPDRRLAGQPRSAGGSTYFLVSLASLAAGRIHLPRHDPRRTRRFRRWSLPSASSPRFSSAGCRSICRSCFRPTPGPTGAGVSFNFGRILTGLGVLGDRRDHRRTSTKTTAGPAASRRSSMPSE